MMPRCQSPNCELPAVWIGVKIIKSTDWLKSIRLCDYHAKLWGHVYERTPILEETRHDTANH